MIYLAAAICYCATVAGLIAWVHYRGSHQTVELIDPDRLNEVLRQHEQTLGAHAQKLNALNLAVGLRNPQKEARG